MPSASRILRALAESDEPKFEWQTSATFGVMPNRRMRNAACSVASAIWRASGSFCTWVSVKNSGPLSLITTDMADTALTCGSMPMMSMTCLSLPLYLPTMPHSMASASPRLTISAATTVPRERTMALAAGGLTPRRAMMRR